jgi:hypothetical protein
VSIKNSSGNIRNQTSNLPACSVVPQASAPPRAPYVVLVTINCSTAFEDVQVSSKQHENKVLSVELLGTNFKRMYAGDTV